MSAIRIFAKDSQEYKMLEKTAEMLTEKSPNGYVYKVEETYFDYGQGWKWTTVIAHTPDGDSYQALSPREQGLIVEEGICDLETTVKLIFESKYCPDRKR